MDISKLRRISFGSGTHNTRWNNQTISFFLHEGRILAGVESDIAYSREVFDRNTTYSICCTAHAVALS